MGRVGLRATLRRDPPRLVRAALAAALLVGGSASRPEEQCHVVVSPRAAAVAGAQRLGQGLGVQVQSWYLKPGDLDRIRNTGFGTIRWGMAWDAIERSPGRYDWRETDRFMSEIARSDLRSVVILAYGNHLYAGPGGTPAPATAAQYIDARPPVAPAARAAFARFAAAAAARYRDRAVTWEIWNEPDNATFWAPRPDTAAYATLAAEACPAMRAAAPGATILGGAGAAMPNAVAAHDNLYAALRHAGAFACLDGVSSHAYRMSRGYRSPDPESVAWDYAASRRYLAADLRLPRGKTSPLTEWGFTTTVVGPDLQAAYLLRASLTTATSGVPLTIWYEWRDSRADTDDPEAHFGLVNAGGEVKNGGAALAILSRIARATVVAPLSGDCDDARAVLLDEGGRRTIVAWLRTAGTPETRRFYVNGVSRGIISFMPSVFEVTFR